MPFHCMTLHQITACSFVLGAKSYTLALCFHDSECVLHNRNAGYSEQSKSNSQQTFLQRCQSGSRQISGDQENNKDFTLEYRIYFRNLDDPDGSEACVATCLRYGKWSQNTRAISPQLNILKGPFTKTTKADLSIWDSSDTVTIRQWKLSTRRQQEGLRGNLVTFQRIPSTNNTNSVRSSPLLAHFFAPHLKCFGRQTIGIYHTCFNQPIDREDADKQTGV